MKEKKNHKNKNKNNAKANNTKVGGNISNNLTIYCQGATGLPFDKDVRGSVAFLTIGEKTKWEVVRFDYDKEFIIDRLEKRETPFYVNLKNTVKYASIGNN